MTTIDKKRFSGVIRGYRKQHDLTQKEFAQKLLTTMTTVARWELGISIPKNERMLRELKNLGIKV